MRIYFPGKNKSTWKIWQNKTKSGNQKSLNSVVVCPLKKCKCIKLVFVARYFSVYVTGLVPNLLIIHFNNFSRRGMQAKFAAERDWNKYHTPRNLLLALVGEVGELSEIL